LNPKVTVIIPNYNHEQFLVQRLESVFNQSFQDFEVILLDDRSTDGSVSILNEYASHPKVSHFIVNEENSGSPFKQWKKGIELALGDYIWIAESDDFCELTFLDKLLKYLIKDSTIGIVYCQTDDVNESGICLNHRINYTKRFQPNIWQIDFIEEGKLFVKSYLSFFNVIPNTSAVVFKKELVNKYVFSAALLQMKMCGDWYFWVKIVLESKIGFVSETLNYFRTHQSISRNHSDIVKKKRRLLEESEIRSFLQLNQIDNLQSEKLLYRNWFNLYRSKAIFKKCFYDIKLKNTSLNIFFRIYFQSEFAKFKRKIK
jgi:glycosyltransferase involved in cell wall biosynthesis